MNKKLCSVILTLLVASFIAIGKAIHNPLIIITPSTLGWSHLSWIVYQEYPFTRGVTGIFFWGGKVIFPDFFTGGTKFPFWYTQKQKKKKKKKKRSSRSRFFNNFSYLHFQFSTFLLQFSFFSSQFSPLFPFFLASFFPIRQQKFPGQKSRGGHSAPRLLRHCHLLKFKVQSHLRKCSLWIPVHRNPHRRKPV